MSVERLPAPLDPDPMSVTGAIPGVLLHPRREPFEYGLLPIPKLIFSDPTHALSQLKQKMGSGNQRVMPSMLSDFLQISPDHARIVLDTLTSVLPSESDPLVRASVAEIDTVGADLRDVLMFLYIQSYKKLLPRSHKDAAAVADVWPSTSAFDGYLSALSPLQLVRSNSRRFMPSIADEEAHQLTYLQKHIGNIVSLLAEHADGESEDSLVLSMDAFERLGFFIQFSDKWHEEIPLSQASPFFVNSDPDMPAVPVPADQVLGWILQNITVSLGHVTERISTKENGPTNMSDQDVTMAEACSNSTKTLRGSTFVEGISKTSYAKQACDFKSSSVKVVNCHDSAIYILAPLRYATIYGCSDTTVILGAVGKAVRIEHCERIHVITAAKQVFIANCRECVFLLGVNQRPLMIGDNHKLQLAPYNTFYPELEEHMAEVGVDASINKWNEPLAVGIVDPLDSMSHPAGLCALQAELATLMDPDQFTDFLIPHWYGGSSAGSTRFNPFLLPDVYMASQQQNQKNLGEIKQLLRDTALEDGQKRELSHALHLVFKDWLYASGNIRQLYCLQGD